MKLNQIAKASIFSSILLLSSAAIAEPFYAGSDFSFTTLSDSEDDYRTPLLNLKLGMEFTDMLSAEARIGFGIGYDQDKSYDNAIGELLTIRAEANTSYGLYGLARLQNSSKLTPYALLGYTQTEFEFSGSIPGHSSSFTEDFSGITYGLGVDVAIDERYSANFEFTRFSDSPDGSDTDLDIDSINLGFTYKF